MQDAVSHSGHRKLPHKLFTITSKTRLLVRQDCVVIACLQCVVIFVFVRLQTILVSGDSGSGKTESTKFMMQYLAAVANHTLATANTEQQVWALGLGLGLGFGGLVQPSSWFLLHYARG